MRILLYGGTFDPPHNGHLNNLRATAACVKPDLAIVMPAGVPPHKRASTTPAALRLSMCACFAALAGEENLPRVEVSDWEIRQAEAGRANFTVLTLEMLAEKYPGAELFFALGSDMLCTFTQWRRWQDILTLACAVVESRETGDEGLLRKAAARLAPYDRNIRFARARALPLASSEVRARLAAGEDCRAALPESVRAVIARAGLYRTAETPPDETPCDKTPC